MPPSPTLPLDCTPLPPRPKARISEADIRRIEPVQQVLLRPLEYESVDAWRRAVNETLNTALGGDMALFQLDSPGVALHYSDELDPEILSSYPELMPDFETRRGIFARSLMLGAGNRYTLWKRHLGWLYQSDYFNEMIVGLRAFDTLWATAPVAGAKYPAMLHTYHERREGGRRFGAADVQLMRLARPALEAGVRMVQQLHESRRSLAGAIDHLAAPVLAFDQNGRLLHRNPSASAVADSAGGESLSAAAAELARSFAGASDGVVAGSICRRVTTLSGTYDLDASPLAPGLFHSHPAVLVTATDRAEHLPTKAKIRDRFDLTPRQAEIALLLAERLSNAEIAERLFISPHTALRHTEAVMSKLKVGDRRQVADRLRPSR